ncbi:MAG: class I SAM-dependent methyltransferase [Flavobacteriales bacterium]|nr:class I SAM-dependent methyltransferase [Flavobacteriales bacterium]
MRKIPFLRRIVGMFHRPAPMPSTFTSSGNYWEERYSQGGNSGSGSYAKFAEFKAEVLNDLVAQNQIGSVIELGCGDGNQLALFRFGHYIGYDVSPTVLDKCRALFMGDPTKEFRDMKSYSGEQADLSLSLDVIYHLIEDEVFNAYMRDLFRASRKFVIIYSSNRTEDEFASPSAHVRHRKFTDWVSANAPEFKQIARIPNRYPYNGDPFTSSFADFYIFQRS